MQRFISISKSATCLKLYDLYHSKEGDGHILYIADSEDEALDIASQSSFFLKSENVIHIPSWDCLPYDRTSPSSEVLSNKIRSLYNIRNADSKKLIIASANAFMQKTMPKEKLEKAVIKLEIGSNINQERLIRYLVDNSYRRVATSADAGEFSVRGEIVDIVTHSEEAYRIVFAFDEIEQIKIFDTVSQVSGGKINSLTLFPVSEIIFDSETLTNFKNNFLKNFGVNHNQSEIYKATLESRKLNGLEHLLPLFYQKLQSIAEYIKGNYIIAFDSLVSQAIESNYASIDDFYESRLETNKSRINPGIYYYLLAPEDLWFSKEEIEQVLKQNSIRFDLTNEAENESVPNFYLNAQEESKLPLEQFNNFKSHHKDNIIIISSRSEAALNRTKKLFDHYNTKYNEVSSIKLAKKNAINLAVLPFEGGVIYKDICLISDDLIFGKRLKAKQQASKKLKNILTELDSLNEGELVVHTEHGIGRFEKIETINAQGRMHDCLKIVYKDNDILYLPVENIDLIKRFGADNAELDKLGGVSWQRRKSKIKDRIGEVAAKLIKIAAERELTKIEPVEVQLGIYDEFCNKFPYTETDDQLTAISDIRNDLEAGHPMDRLICGDVGFGKTEVAMRAAFMVASANHPQQVAIIAPTTILARQHYINFIERFRGFGLKIAQISRLVKPEAVRMAKEGLRTGEINIVIGTHALLAKNVDFKNLGLLIVDEEQRFGVKQKERIKELKSSLHVLSLSATPIPRTLQMAMLGIRGLSLIATPPIDRLSVRTSVAPLDAVIIKDALLKEHFRGGRSFYVVPRIEDIKDIEQLLKTIVPNLTYRIAHGQMSGEEIDEIMSDFYEGKFDILISTTIIESGIDVPSANTMIIHRAEMFGLSQLYQLRGRVGRSKVRGFAYLTLNPKKMLNPIASKRLQIMQTVDSLGAGFSIASHDMDIRGFGNLVGEEQAGHIREVGAELYQDMLQHEIDKLKLGGYDSGNHELSPLISLGVAVYIPDNYIDNSSLRMGLYRRIADLKSEQEVTNFIDEMEDRFGAVPEPMLNLLDIVRIKLICKELNVEKLDSGPKGFTIKFAENEMTDSAMILNFVNKYPRYTKFKPENKLVFLKDLDANTQMIIEAEKILTELKKSKVEQK